MEQRSQRPYDLTGNYEGPHLYTPREYECNTTEKRSIFGIYLFTVITAVVILIGTITALIIFPSALHSHTHTLFTHSNNCPSDVNAKDSDEWTPLHFAALEGDVDKVRLLLDCGADVNAKDNDKETPLLKAAMENKVDVARLLLDRDADVNTKTCTGDAPLHWAAYEGYLDMARLLLDRGADVNIQNKNGITPLGEADTGHHAEMVALLRSRGGHE